MESGRLFFDPSCHGNMLFLGNSDPLFRGGRAVVNMEETSKRRPFFSSPDELYDEEYYDEQLPEKKRRLTPEQVVMLEKSFEVENKLEPDRKSQLAKKLGLQPRQVAVWFQNRRARWKTKQLEREYDLLKSSYHSLLSDFDSIRKDNDLLKAQVMSLTEKVAAKEVAGGEPSSGPKPDPLPVETHDVSALPFSVKVEDRLSSGSNGSAVVDEEGPAQLVDSSTGDSFFQTNHHHHHHHGGYPVCLPLPVDNHGVHSEDPEDDGSDDGRSYFPNFAAGAEQQNHEAMGWWDWS